VQAPAFGGAQLRTELERGQAGAVQDLVGVGVADCGEDPRVRERTLERVVLARQRRGERLIVSGSKPPASSAASAAASGSRWSAARCFVDASVRSSVPAAKSNAASPVRFGIAIPAARQCSRPEIMRWMARKSPPSSASTSRLPTRRASSTTRPLAASSGGSVVRSRFQPATRTRSSRAPAMRRFRCST
jgi:hypothetical protein